MTVIAQDDNLTAGAWAACGCLRNLINFVEDARNKKGTAALDILRPRKFHFLKLMSD